MVERLGARTAGPPLRTGWNVEVEAGDVTGRLRTTAVAASVLSGHRLVTARPDGRVGYADAATLAHLHLPLWLTLGAAGAGAAAALLLQGPLVEPSWSWTPGPLYLGADGALVQAPPARPDAVFLAQVGAATGPTSIYLDRQPSILLA